MSYFGSCNILVVLFHNTYLTMYSVLAKQFTPIGHMVIIIPIVFFQDIAARSTSTSPQPSSQPAPPAPPGVDAVTEEAAVPAAAVLPVLPPVLPTVVQVENDGHGELQTVINC